MNKKTEEINQALQKFGAKHALPPLIPEEKLQQEIDDFVQQCIDERARQKNVTVGGVYG